MSSSVTSVKFISLITITILFITIIPLSHALPRVIRIGGLFSAAEQEPELVFHAAIEKVNANFANRTIFEAVVEHARPYNSYEAHFKTCDLLRHSPVAVVGPFNPISSLQVQSICEHLEVPHLEARLMVDFQPRTDLSIQLYPHLSTLSRAYLDIIDAWGWTAFAVIIQESDSIVHFKDFFPHATAKGWEVRLFQLQPDRPYRDILWQVKRLKMRNILLDVRTDHLLEVLRQAQQVGIMTERHHYLITSLDLHTLPLENYRHSQTNITSLRIVREENHVLQSLLTDWPAYAARFMPRSQIPPPEHLSSKSAMIFDGVQILALGLAELDQFSTPPQETMSCEDNASPWQYGASVLNYVRQVRHEGLTGYVAFDETSSFRSKLSFEVLSTMDTDFEVIATWTDWGGSEEENFGKNGLVMGTPKERAGFPKPDHWLKMMKGSKMETQHEDLAKKQVKERLSKTAHWNRHSPNDANFTIYRVSTKLIDPYLYEANNTKELHGNARFDGYVVDLLDAISAMLNIHYELMLVKDKENGGKDKVTGNWTGMIAEVIHNRADLAISDLTITPEREEVVDFTYPFMATGIQILYKRPTEKVTSLWSFLSPFSRPVWISLISAIVSISMILFYVGRFTPYQWLNPNPCPHHDPILENELTSRNSFWCTVGSLMQQGTEVAPKTLSTRIICAIWYFFTLIIVSSYTANLAAFLTVEKETWPFQDAQGLAAQKVVRYGCLISGSTRKFFDNSKVPVYQTIKERMDAHSDCSGAEPDPNKCWFTSSNAEGEARVEREDGKYAFFMESASIEFTQERQCNLTSIGPLLDNKGYGIATRKNDPLRGKLSEAILQLQEQGVLQKLKEKWWKQKGGGLCIAKPPPATTELTLKNLGGVFLVLVVGTVFAVLLVFMEFLIKKKVSSGSGGGSGSIGGGGDGAKSSFRKDLWEDLVFALSCWQSTKPVRQKSLKSLSGSRSGGLEKAPDGGNAFPMKAYY